MSEVKWKYYRCGDKQRTAYEALIAERLRLVDVYNAFAQKHGGTAVEVNRLGRVTEVLFDGDPPDGWELDRYGSYWPDRKSPEGKALLEEMRALPRWPCDEELARRFCDNREVRAFEPGRLRTFNAQFIKVGDVVLLCLPYREHEPKPPIGECTPLSEADFLRLKADAMDAEEQAA